MKRYLLCMAAVVALLCAGPVHAKTWTLTTAPDGTATSGNTTVANGGTSTFCLYGESAVYDFYPQLDRIYAYGFQISHVTPSQAGLAAGNWSGVTYSVYMKFKSESDAVPWAAVEPVYFFKDIAANSSVTPEMRWVNARPGDRMRAYFVSEGGNTPFGLATAKLVASEIPVYGEESLVLLNEGTFTMPASGTGVSQFTVASIAAWTTGTVAASFEIVSGTSAYFTLNGDTPTTSIGFRLLDPATYYGALR
ncbi:MAG: hypothetical protein ABIJ57_10840, partial [Pseudomonadota bacterium]